MQPLGNNVWLRQATRSKSSGGVDIPPKYQGLTQEAVVVAIGRGTIDEDTGEVLPILDIEVGDRVLHLKRAGQVVKVHGQEVRVIPYTQLLVRLDVGEFKRCAWCQGEGVVVNDAKACALERLLGLRPDSVQVMEDFLHDYNLWDSTFVDWYADRLVQERRDE